LEQQQIELDHEALQQLASKIKGEQLRREEEIRQSIMAFTPEEMYEFLTSYVETTELVLDGLSMASSMNTLSEAGAICFTALDKCVAGLNFTLDWIDAQHDLGKVSSADEEEEQAEAPKAKRPSQPATEDDSAL
jgi:hypothetical protein